MSVGLFPLWNKFVQCNIILEVALSILISLGCYNSINIEIVTAKPDCGCDQAMDWNQPTTPPPQTFNCQYLSHFSTDWAEIFFGNPPVGISNDQTEEQAGAELGQAQCLA